MIALEIIAVIIVALLIFYAPLFFLYRVVKWFWEKYIEPSSFVSVKKQNTELILTSQFRYYQSLDNNNKEKFLKRTSEFISSREFRSAENMELSEEMIVLVSASAIQLTLGLDAYLLDSFTHIYIYPKEFYSRIQKQYHKGETNLAGAIVFSWQHFQEGYRNPSDNLNLGLHEMAHALKFDRFRNDDYDRFFSEYMDKWQMVSKEEFLRIKNKAPSFFRQYAGANFSEFFSVCVEYFFESPKEFKENHPEIFHHLCILLNQNPAKGEVGVVTIRTDFGKTFQHIGISQLIYKGKMQGMFFGILPLSFVIYLIYYNIDNGALLFILSMVGLFYIFSILNIIRKSMNKIEFCTNGIRIISSVNSRFDRVFFNDRIVKIKLVDATEDTAKSSMVISEIVDGKIIHKQYEFEFTRQEKIEIASNMKAKKIPISLPDIKSFERLKD